MRPDGGVAFVSCDASKQVAVIHQKNFKVEAADRRRPAGRRPGLAGRGPSSRSLAVSSVAVWLAAAPVLAHEGPRLGVFEGHGDVGGPKIAGASFFSRLNQEYTLSAAGANVWAARDEFHFAWRR